LRNAYFTYCSDHSTEHPGLPAPASSGIEHVVVVTMENRSFDHFLGWLPNAVGQQAGLNFTDKSGASHATHSLSGDFTGCPQADPDHTYDGSRVAYDGGKMDGFLRAGSNDLFSIGYYEEKDIPFYATLARNYATCDHYFAAILGPTFPNRVFLYAGQTDRTDNSAVISSLPTIFDRLADAQVSHNYYYSNVPFLTLWGRPIRWYFETPQRFSCAGERWYPAGGLLRRPELHDPGRWNRQ
jgi:phospholipase C